MLTSCAALLLSVIFAPQDVSRAVAPQSLDPLIRNQIRWEVIKPSWFGPALELTAVDLKGKKIRCLLDTSSASTTTLARYLSDDASPYSLQLSSGEGVNLSPGLTDGDHGGIGIYLGMDVMKSTVLILDHDKRFSLLSVRSWDRVSMDLFGPNPHKYGLDVGADRVPFMKINLGNAPTSALVATVPNSLQMGSKAASSYGLPINLPGISYGAGPDVIGVSQASLSLGAGLPPETFGVEVIPDLAAGDIKAILGKAVFANHLVAFDFPDRVVYISID